MAVVPFDCNKIKRNFWPFTMKDKEKDGKVVEKGRKILVRMPQKKVFEAIKELGEIDEDDQTMEDTDAIYNLLAAVLNNNKGKITITVADLEDYDIEECTEILEAYMEFVGALKTDPN